VRSREEGEREREKGVREIKNGTLHTYLLRIKYSKMEIRE
jgi:hypothetical protein